MGDRSSAFRWLLCHFVPFLGFCTFCGLYLACMPFCTFLFPLYARMPYTAHLVFFPFLVFYFPPCPPLLVSFALSFTALTSFDHLFRPSFTALTSSSNIFHPFCRTPHLSGPKGPPFRPFRPSFYGFTAWLTPALKAIGAIKKAGPTACRDTKP